MSTKVKTEPSDEELPKDWLVFHSKNNNKVYYFNTVTKKTQWEHPLNGYQTNKNGKKIKSKKSRRKEKSEKNTNDFQASQKNKKQDSPTDETNVPQRTKSETPLESAEPHLNIRTEVPRYDKKFNGNIQSLPPITQPKSLGSFSEESVSDSSDRIAAWLEDTSRINFQEHPVPDVNDLNTTQSVNKSKAAKINSTPKSNIKSSKFKERKKVAILERVKNSTESSEKKRNNILDQLLPKHVSHKSHSKARYAPYKSGAVSSEDQKKPRKDEMFLDQRTSVAEERQRRGSRSSVRLDGGQINQTNRKSTSGRAVQVKKSDLSKNWNSHLRSRNTSVTRNDRSQPQQSIFVSNHDIPHEVRITGNDTRRNNPKGTQLKLSDDAVQFDDALSMEEDEGANVAVPSSGSEVADMEIDNAEEFEKEIVQKLKQMRNNLVVDPSNSTRENYGTNIANDGYEGSLYIVLDTNVLLSHLKFVVELKDFPIQGVGRPILVIPWVVIQELDSLKDSKRRTHQSHSADSNDVEERVDMLARVAIKFLNGCFQKSDPRVRGQTVDEAAEHVGNLKEESNDDRILQCCLLFQERARSGNCVLFSNDRNLCNKALVNGIKAFNHQRLIPGLRDLFQCGAIVQQAYFDEYKSQLRVQEELAWRREKADEILCELQIILREGLSFIIETEMKEAYDDIWPNVVLIKPPWTLIDVLQLLEKHWIAVFGHVLKRNQKTVVEELKKKFDDRKGSPSSLVFSLEVLQLGSELFQSFGAHSNYNNAIPKCLAAVNVLIQKCQQYQYNCLTDVQSNPNIQPRCLTLGPEVDQTSDGNLSPKTVEEQDGIVRSNSTLPHEEVMGTFNLIWTAVTQFSTQIFNALGYPNSIPHELVQDLPKPSKEEAVQFLGVLCPRLINLVNSIQNVLRDPWEKVSRNNSLFVQLEQAVAVFLKEVLSRDNCASPEKLFRFCQDASMRTSLVQGLSQLDRASAMLQHCASCVVEPGGMR